MKRQENMGSARNVARCITRGRVTRVVIILVGVVAAIGDAPVAVVNHVAFVCGDHHRVVLRGEGLDQRIHIVLNPTRQVAPNSRGYGGDGGVEIKVGVGIQEVAEDAGESALKQATTPFLHKLTSSGRSGLQARHHLGEEGQVAGIVIRVRGRTSTSQIWPRAVLALFRRS